MIPEPITLGATRVPDRYRCATGCGRWAEYVIVAGLRGCSGVTFACGPHRGDGEVKALRMLADTLESQLVEVRRAQSSRTAAQGAAGV